ncbi:hypothetical protein E2562_036945, partial [Oryza meyeriana var. granulata]
STKLIEIYRNQHNISASGGLSDPAVATGISDLMYDSKDVPKEATLIQTGIDPDLAMVWAAGLEDDVWENNAPAVDKILRRLACSDLGEGARCTAADFWKTSTSSIQNVLDILAGEERLVSYELIKSGFTDIMGHQCALLACC